MTGIDATVVLGLAGKMGQVFADEGVYQAFPLTPIGLKVDSLRALISDPLGAGATPHAQFSLLVNEIPSGPLWQPDGERLWDVYGEVLTSAELLQTSRTAKQQKAYDKAFGLLYVEGDDSLPVPSKVVVAYEQRRDAYLTVAMEYNNRKGEAELLSDPAVKAAWEADEPKLRAAVDDAAAAWVGPGKRHEVDEARRVLNDLGSDSPLAVWAGFRKLFDPAVPEIFYRTSLEGLKYVPTGYLPTDAADVAWPRITVTADELRQLADAAPQELRSRLAGSSDAGIETVSFEYCYVTVARPWFSPQLFTSRAWRFKDTVRVLSDGGSPPSGECTAYVTGLVLARNITVQRTAAAAESVEQPQTDLGFLPTLMLARDVRFYERISAGNEPPPETGDQPRMVLLDDAVRWRVAAGAVATEAVVAEQPAPEPAAAATPIERPTTSANSLGDRVWMTRMASVRAAEISERPAPEPPRATSAAVTTTDPSDVFVLALQCRKLPKSPDPDPAVLGGTSVQPPGSNSAAGRGKKYTVVSGDSLAKIARRFYGEADQWPTIYGANRKLIGDDPTLIKPGQKLTIP